MPDGDEIRIRDEIMALLFWLEGERFTAHATIFGMLPFFAYSADELLVALERLVARGDVERAPDGTYRLTAAARPEAARRFAEDFGPLLKQGHGACTDPDCDCHTNPDAAADCRAEAAAGGRHFH